MTKSLSALFLYMGFGVFSYFAAPVVVVSLTAIIAQGELPDLSLKDLGSLGGFAVFAILMWYQNRQQIADFRADMKEERATVNRLADSIDRKTAAIESLVDKMGSKV